ncbi:hypothetical protein FHT72_006800 [Rhizobium sp. BK077]|nr:hypothetical protein [Rhizobium sp. BK112]MBB3372265.1 hypothetical protein [Rhizobium sp. BK077]MBB4182730.1 hypothetical protein [Rhizobium sp. BK109]PDS54567.1 hypothetical protein CO663_34465 [Rhizobium anhuiense]
MNRKDLCRLFIIAISIFYFISLYTFLRQGAYYQSVHEEISGIFSIKGIFAKILVVSPQVYLLMVLAVLIQVFRKNDGALRRLMCIWSAILILGSAWTALVIYAINNE